MVIEAVYEDAGVKAGVLAAVEKHLSENAVIASNTSTIPITGMASVLERPWNFCGIHFFNPAPVMKLVEIVRALLTSGRDHRARPSSFPSASARRRSPSRTRPASWRTASSDR